MSYTTMLILNTLMTGNFQIQNSNQLISFNETDENHQMVGALDARGLVRQAADGQLFIDSKELESHLKQFQLKNGELLNFIIAAAPTTSYSES